MRILLILFITCIFQSVSWSQELKNKTQFGIAGVPHYLIRAGIRLDFEKQLSKPNHWLVFAPQIYWFDNPDHTFRDYRKKTGAGLNAYHKVFLNKYLTEPNGFYGMYGVGFQYFNVESDYYYFDIGRWVMEDIEVYRGEINLCIGNQWMVSSNLFLDIYIGVRAKVSNLLLSDEQEKLEIWQDSDFYPTFVSGIRLGVIFPRK